jgi:hypothetical protein
MLIFDRILSGMKDACAAFPDKRKGEGNYSMADIGLAAFFAVLHAAGIVSVSSAFAGGRPEDLQWPHAVWDDENPHRQSHPADARSRASLASARSVRSSGCEAARAWRHEGVRAARRAGADRDRGNRIFPIVQARLPALPYAQGFERRAQAQTRSRRHPRPRPISPRRSPRGLRQSNARRRART